MINARTLPTAELRLTDKACKRKDEPVLDAVMKAHPQWHDEPDVTAAWDAAESAGLDVEAARAGMTSPEINGIIQQDAADVKAVKISGTPTFYVNGDSLSRLGPQELYDLVTSKVESLE